VLYKDQMTKIRPCDFSPGVSGDCA